MYYACQLFKRIIYITLIKSYKKFSFTEYNITNAEVIEINIPCDFNVLVSKIYLKIKLY